MADDKIILTQIDIDVEAAIKDTIRFKEEIELLKAQTAKAKTEQGELSAEYIQYSAALKNAQGDLRTQENLMQKLNTSTDEQVGTIARLEAQNSALRTEQKKLNLETDEGVKRNKEIVAQINANTEAVKKNSDTQKQGWMNVGQYTENIKSAIGDMIPGFNQASTAAKGFGVGLNFALLPITAIVLAIVGLIAYFKRTEEGANKLNKVMAIVGAVFSKITEIVSKVGETMVSAFENPKKAITELWDLIKTNIINRLTGLIDAWKAVGKVIMGVLKLDWDQVKEGAKEFGESTVQALTGVDNLVGKVTDAFNKMSKEIMEVAKAGASLADAEAKLKVMERTAQRVQLEYQKQAEKLRQIRDDESKSIDERIKKNDELGEVLKKQLGAEMAIANQALKVSNMRIAIDGKSTENLDEREQALTKIADIQERITGQESEQLSNLNALRKEALALNIEAKKKESEESINNLELELAIWNETHKSKLASAKTLTAELITEEENRLNLLNQQEQELLQERFDAGLITQQEATLAVLQLENEKNEAIAALRTEFEEQERDRKIEVAQLDYDNELAAAEGQIFNLLELERQGLEKKKKQEIAYAQKIGADTTAIEKKYANANKAISKAEFDAKLSLAGGFAQNIATIAGEQTAVGKAAAVAATTISTFQGATAAFTGMTTAVPGPVGIGLGIAAAAAAVASGLANVKKILSVKSGLPGDGGGGGGSGASASAPAPTSAPDAVVRSSVNPEIGAGIISRTTSTGEDSGLSLQPTLVEDEVTSKQKTKSSMNNTSVL